MLLVEGGVTEHAERGSVTHRHEVANGLGLFVEISLGAGVLVGELDAALGVVNLKDLDVDLHTAALGLLRLLTIRSGGGSELSFEL